MARTRRRSRAGAAVSEDGNTILGGFIEPPPHVVKDFAYKWKNWLNNFYEAMNLNVATMWFNIVGVSTSVDTSPYQVTIVDQVVLADPDTGVLVLDLPDGTVEDGISFYIKNIDESGTFALTVNPGTNKIEQFSGVPTTADIPVVALGSMQIVFDSELSTWWIIY